jgi:hypothetical protein
MGWFNSGRFKNDGARFGSFDDFIKNQLRCLRVIDHANYFITILGNIWNLLYFFNIFMGEHLKVGLVFVEREYCKTFFGKIESHGSPLS